MWIYVEIKQDRILGLRFDEFPQRVHANLLDRITKLTAQLEARVKAAEPTRTGKLRSETRSRVYDDGDHIAGRVFVQIEGEPKSRRGSIDAGKAASLEYGAGATAVVKAHSARLDHVFSRLIEPMTVMVGLHNRQVNIAEHGFLRVSLDAMSAEIVDQLRQALVTSEETA